MNKRTKQAMEDFIPKSNVIFNNYYDYSLVVFTSATTEVNIICPVHGVFLKTPSKHIGGQGCPTCAKNTKAANSTSSKESFLQKAISIHGDKYNYSKVVYTLSKTPVTIICPEHGEFNKSPNKHLSGQGCPKCANSKIGTNSIKPFTDFVKQANSIHNGEYVYCESSYVSSKIKTAITCSTHGVFFMTPDSHINKKCKCPSCTAVSTGAGKKKTNDKFISDATLVHSGFYSYSSTEYVSSTVDVVITCPDHGDFKQTPSNHLAGKGCRECTSGGGGFKDGIPGILYYLSINNGEYYKIGITNRSVLERYSKDEHHKLKVIKEWDFPVGLDARIKERQVLKTHSKHLAPKGTKALRDGNTELFVIDVLELDTTKQSNIG